MTTIEEGCMESSMQWTIICICFVWSNVCSSCYVCLYRYVIIIPEFAVFVCH